MPDVAGKMISISGADLASGRGVGERQKTQHESANYACFWTAQELRMVFTFLNGEKKIPRKIILLPT